MPPEIKCPRPQRPRKRSLDVSDSAAPRPTKRQHILPSPPTPDNSDKAPRPSVFQTAPLTPPNLPRLSKHSCEEAGPAWSRALQENRIDIWLAGTTPLRANSCPPQLGDVDPYVISGLGEQAEQGEGAEEQRPLLEALQKMSQTQKQNCGGASVASVASGRSSRPATSHTDYRKTLRNNGILFDHTGGMIPPQLRSFLDSKILLERSTTLSSEAIGDAVQTTVDIADSPEGNVYDLINTATLPVKRSDVGRGGNTPWATEGLPRNKDYEYPLATAKADVHCGYVTGQRSTWTARENTVIDYRAARRRTQPAKGNALPYLVLELKSEATGGTLWQAENQAAGSGACCVNAARWLLREANPSEEPSVVDTIAFSACVNHRHVVWHVHWYSAENGQQYMSWIATHDTIRQVQQCNHLTLNILDHCQGARQTKLRGALVPLNPIPDHWKQARPASAMNSQAAGEINEDVGSNKSQRTE